MLQSWFDPLSHRHPLEPDQVDGAGDSERHTGGEGDQLVATILALF
jgi:hypothetical protein